MPDIGYLAALFGGVLALLSPCSALLLPSFFAYAFGSRRALAARTVAFYVGLAAVLVPLGGGSTVVAAVFIGHRELLIQIAGWAIIGFGILQLLGGGFGSRRAAAAQQRLALRRGWLSTVGLGAAYGLAGFCSGPILGSVLTVAAASGRPFYGAALLAVYALGMTAPMFVLALAWDRLDLGRRRWLRGRPITLGRLHLPPAATLLSGALFIAIGAVFLVYDGTAGITGAFGLDTTSAEFDAQQTIQAIAARIPNWALPTLGVAVLAAVVVRRVRRELASPVAIRDAAEPANIAHQGEAAGDTMNANGSDRGAPRAVPDTCTGAGLDDSRAPRRP